MTPDELKQLLAETLRETGHHGTVLSKEELKELVHDSVVETMTPLGIDAESPLNMQRDMQFIRELRLTSEKIKNKTILTLIGLLVVAGVGAIWLGIRTYLT